MQFLKKHSILIISAVLFIVAFVLSTIYDLQISKVIADIEDGEYLSKNVFGRIFEVTGELPLYMFLGFAFTVCTVKCGNFKGGAGRLALSIFFAIGSSVAYHFVFKEGVEYVMEYANLLRLLEGKIDEACFILLGVASYFVTNLLIKNKSQKTINLLTALSVIIILTAGASQFIVQGLKIVSGRARYRMMHLVTTATGEDAFSYYTPWYVFNGKRTVFEKWVELGVNENGFKSFPSGHTSAGAITVCLIVLPKLFKNLNTLKGKTVCYGIAIIFPIIVAISRVVVGAHFLTDVLFAGATTFICYFIIEFIVNKFKLYKELIKD